MFNIADLPVVRAQLDRDAAEKTASLAGAPAEPQYVRAPEGNGHEAALKGGTR